jgi:hypothetical protein
MGPLILMSLEMIKDCARFLFMLGGVFLAFSVALTTLLKPISISGSEVNEMAERLSEEDGLDEQVISRCEKVFGARTPYYAVWQTITSLVELVLGGDPNLAPCLVGHSIAPLVMGFFRALVILMALNMLIAQMSTTYERIRERLATNVMYLTATVSVVAMNESHVPAPFKVLGLPYYMLGLMRLTVLFVLDALRTARSLLRGYHESHGAMEPQVDGSATGGVQPRHPGGGSLTKPVPRSAGATAPMRRASFVAKLERARSSREQSAFDGKRASREEIAEDEVMLREAVVTYLANFGADATASDERWKTRQSHQLAMIGNLVTELSGQVGHMQRQFRDLKAAKSGSSGGQRAHGKHVPSLNTLHEA